MTNDVSPYLQRPVRRLEEAIAEAEQQRLEQPPVAQTRTAIDAQKSKSATTASTPS